MFVGENVLSKLKLTLQTQRQLFVTSWNMNRPVLKGEQNKKGLWALFLFLIAASWTAAAMKLMISTPTWSRSSLLKAPFQRFAILSWTWLGCTFQVFCLKLLLLFWVFILIHHKYSCSLAKWDPDVHFPLGRFEWPGHASPGAALFGLQGFLHLCKVSGPCLVFPYNKYALHARCNVP